jgi:hypothetical protein
MTTLLMAPGAVRMRKPWRSATSSLIPSKGLGSLFDTAWQTESAEAMSELHRMCVAFVRRLRHDGYAPEQVLVAMKREITKGGLVHRAPSLSCSLLDSDDLERARVYEQLFRWFLDACFVS